MRFPRYRVLLSVTLIGLAPGAGAQSVPPIVGSDLLRSCAALLAYAEKGGPITVDATSCAAYLKGLRDGIDAPVQSRGPADRAFCASGAPLDELARIVVKHLQEQSDSMRRHASGEALVALARAYPCARK
jgi:hypothetical protein